MNIEAATLDLKALLETMEAAVMGVGSAAEAIQKQVSKIVRDVVLSLEIKGGRLVREQDFLRRLAQIEIKINQVLGSSKYTQPIADYLSEISTIEQRNIAMQKKYGDLIVDVEKLTPARKAVYQQAKHYLSGAGLNEAYVQPAKYLVMQQVTTGMSIKDSLELLKKWDEGKLTDGKQTMGRQTPNLQRYATQLSRDMMYQYNGNINNIIKDEYALDAFIYTGTIVKDSRPLCRHLVGLNREIKFDELPELLNAYPQGTIPGTNKDNFAIYRGGYSCLHGVLAVRSKQKT